MSLYKIYFTKSQSTQIFLYGNIQTFFFPYQIALFWVCLTNAHPSKRSAGSKVALPCLTYLDPCLWRLVGLYALQSNLSLFFVVYEWVAMKYFSEREEFSRTLRLKFSPEIRTTQEQFKDRAKESVFSTVRRFSEETCVSRKRVHKHSFYINNVFKLISYSCIVWSVQVRRFVWSVFSRIRSVSLHIQSECGKIRTRENSVFGNFLRIATVW